MRKYPHKPSEKELVEIREVTEASYRRKPAKASAAIAARNPQFFELTAEDAQSLAALSYAMESPVAEVRQFLVDACNYGQKAVEFGVTLDPVLFQSLLALALLCDDAALAAVLKSLPRSSFTNPNVTDDEIFYLVAESYRDLSAGNDAGARRAVSAGLVRAGASEVNSDARDNMRPLLLLEAAILDKDSGKLAEAIQERHEEKRRSHSPKDARNDPNALLDIIGLGLLKIAKSRGMSVPAASVYLPVELL